MTRGNKMGKEIQAGKKYTSETTEQNINNYRKKEQQTNTKEFYAENTESSGLERRET